MRVHARAPLHRRAADKRTRRARELAQQQLDLHLEDRYLVQPASLYQIARGSKRSAIDMDVPVVGDWVMIAVLAEKGEIRFVNAQKPVKKGAKKDADKDEVDEKDRKKKKRRKPEDDDSSGGESALDGSDDEADKSRQERDAKPRRYISFKMVDLSSAKTSSAGQSSVSLYLYESDSRAGDVKRGEDGVERGAYRGGSGGAYERWWKESEGAVLAILNPRVTKPFNVRLLCLRWCDVAHSACRTPRRPTLASSRCRSTRQTRSSSSGALSISRTAQRGASTAACATHGATSAPTRCASSMCARRSAAIARLAPNSTAPHRA